MRITSNIFQVGGSMESHPSDAAIYLIAGKAGEAALVDSGTGLGHQHVLKNIRQCGVQPQHIKYLFLTHCHFDHTGGALELRRDTGCVIAAHELDTQYIEDGDNYVTAASWYREIMNPTRVDVKLKGDEIFNIGGVQVAFYHAPGHSPGSSVLTARSDDQLVLFAQDVHGPLNDELLSNRQDYYKSLEFLISLNADILCEGHFGIYRGKEAVRDFIEEYL